MCTIFFSNSRFFKKALLVSTVLIGCTTSLNAEQIRPALTDTRLNAEEARLKAEELELIKRLEGELPAETAARGDLNSANVSGLSELANELSTTSRIRETDIDLTQTSAATTTAEADSRMPSNVGNIKRKVYTIDSKNNVLLEETMELQMADAENIENGWEEIKFEKGVFKPLDQTVQLSDNEETIALDSGMTESSGATDNMASSNTMAMGRMNTIPENSTSSEAMSAAAGNSVASSSKLRELTAENMNLREQLLATKIALQSGQPGCGKTTVVESALPAENPAEDTESVEAGMGNILRASLNSKIDQAVDKKLDARELTVKVHRAPLRTGPSPDSSPITYLDQGTVLTADYYNSGWFRVYTADGVRAWISERATE